MARTLKILGQADLAATTLTDVYTVPSLTQSVVSSIVVCNRNGASRTFRISVAVGGAADDSKQYLVYDDTIDANKSLAFLLGVSLGAADKVRAYASAVGVSVNVFGVEEA